MRSTHKILMLSTVLLGTSLAMAQAQTSTSLGNKMPMPDALQNEAQPVGAYSSVHVLLSAANKDIAAGNLGLAMERLDQAKTKIINTWQQKTNGPQTYAAVGPVDKGINDARFALAKNDTAGAQQIITQILASNSPELAY